MTVTSYRNVQDGYPPGASRPRNRSNLGDGARDSWASPLVTGFVSESLLVLIRDEPDLDQLQRVLRARLELAGREEKIDE